MIDVKTALSVFADRYRPVGTGGAQCCPRPSRQRHAAWTWKVDHYCGAGGHGAIDNHNNIFSGE
ncbi:hypothetical protein DD559_08495 [Sphingomonas pokkalii]|uniref:Uncharacterized protein n=1 Tax=Sphingomonas pokkalii TaxID=2175090 RepID=A0A2U0SDI3_9SPHN|nr:hypothetical protein DD559_08495 [Sphingomonas pokkalii]